MKPYMRRAWLRLPLVLSIAAVAAAAPMPVEAPEPASEPKLPAAGAGKRTEPTALHAAHAERLASDPPGQQEAAEVAAEVQFMRRFIERVNPSLLVEDPVCAAQLPAAIYRGAQRHGLAWHNLFTLAWQESAFDCHAKNPRDKGGAYGPFQIRRLWEPVIGDPRPAYFEPGRAVERVVGVVQYYRSTRRYKELEERRFRNPLLCLYNSGESRRVNMRYCRAVGRKKDIVERAWQNYEQGQMVAQRS